MKPTWVIVSFKNKVGLMEGIPKKLGFEGSFTCCKFFKFSGDTLVMVMIWQLKRVTEEKLVDFEQIMNIVKQVKKWYHLERAGFTENDWAGRTTLLFFCI